ncbi:cytochrome P450 71AV8-like [Rutidosis leptorrhynchoides]|uniref:cytochrome P450 71AV8-like n=1 Tax=Rutidosis leptorrhynchoides TaxID=125765 RepID=UPI003A993E71
MSFLIYFATLFLFITIITLFKSSEKNLPPQPWKLPVIGHLHHLLGALPHHALTNLAKKHGPIIHLKLGQVSTVVISSPNLAKDIMNTHDLSFAGRSKSISAEIISYNYKDIACVSYGEYWRQMRKICVLELLSAKKVRSFQSIREKESWNLIESIKGSNNAINLSEKIYMLMNTITSKNAVGSVSMKDQGRLVSNIKQLLLIAGTLDVENLFPSIKGLHLITRTRYKLMKIFKIIDEILDNIISNHQERRSSGQREDNEDLLDVLLRLQHDGGLQFPLTYDHIKAVIMDVFLAGTDTSSSTIEWAMSELLRNPRVMKKLQEELRKTLKGKKKIQESDIQEVDYLKQVIKETLRLHPSIPLLIPRECRKKCEIGGYNIPVGTNVLINAWKIGRDPDYWIDPDSFVPERFIESSDNMMGKNFEYLPFGAGRRMCPGLILGLANVELPLAMLLYYFNWDLPNGAPFEDLDMSESFGSAVKRTNHLILVPSHYNIN